MPGVIEAGDVGLVKFTKLCRIEKHLNSFKASQQSLSPATKNTRILSVCYTERSRSGTEFRVVRVQY